MSVYQTYDDEANTDVFSVKSYYNTKNWHMIDKFCGTRIPAPFITNEYQKQIKFTFFSDNVNYAQGFEFNYDYVRLPECIFDYTTDSNKSSGQIVISSDLKTNYYCDWYVNTEADKSILLTIKNQDLGI